MILDNIAEAGKYEKLHPLFKQAFDFLKSLDFDNLTMGKTELDGKNLFVVISESTLKNSCDSLLEAHNEYIDIQMPISKTEIFGWGYRKNQRTESVPYDETKDVLFYQDKPATYLDVCPGNFVIFFPDDAHAPCIGEGSVIKIVVKIKVNPK